jgi:hypothetical protein
MSLSLGSLQVWLYDNFDPLRKVSGFYHKREGEVKQAKVDKVLHVMH